MNGIWFACLLFRIANINSFRYSFSLRCSTGTDKSVLNILRSPEGIPIQAVVAPRSPLNKLKYKVENEKKRILKQGAPREQEILNPNKLKIIAGRAKGRNIDSPDVYLRPMMSKVREALFSSLYSMGLFDTNTTRVLDIFAGSGSIGLEALSRGANHATFVDFSPECIKTALKNAAKLGFATQVSSVCASAEAVLRNPSAFGLMNNNKRDDCFNVPYDLICLTPPYEEVIYNDLINAVCNTPIIAENSIVVIEYPVEMGSLPHVLGNSQLFGVRNRRYGRTVLGIYSYKPTMSISMKPEQFKEFKVR